MIEILQPGLFTTVQDSGRRGYISRGISPSGAFDNLSYRLGNLIVGNSPGGAYLINDQINAACLEATGRGPKMKILREVVVAITGANMTPKIDNYDIEMWKAIRVHKGSVLSFSNVKEGFRAYICFAGGIDVPLVLGSRSTFSRGKLGGFKGRELRRGDRLEISKPVKDISKIEGRRLRPEIIPTWDSRSEIRINLGPQANLFTDKSLSTFMEAEWKVSSEMNRSGIRLVGPKLDFKARPEYLKRIAGSDPSNIVSDPIPLGGVQVPSGIEVIICGVEGPGLGGYAKIATVISTDLSLVAQMRPGDTVNFKIVGLDEIIGTLDQNESLVSEQNIIE
jgi:biotin-dependent carboxylase-like uncharacterized protein